MMITEAIELIIDLFGDLVVGLRNVDIMQFELDGEVKTLSVMGLLFIMLTLSIIFKFITDIIHEDGSKER